MHQQCSICHMVFVCFTDDNECSLGTHNCSSEANCTDTVGGYSCSCQTGFYGNGFLCLLGKGLTQVSTQQLALLWIQGSVYMDQHMRNTLESTTNNYVSTSPSYTLAVDSLSMLTSIVPSLSTIRNSLIGRVLCSVLGTYCVDLNLCNNSFADYYSGDDDSALLCTSLCTLL